jgi:hypothetical protein
MYLKEIKAEMTVSRMQSAKWFVQNATDQIKKGLK